MPPPRRRSSTPTPADPPPSDDPVADDLTDAPSTNALSRHVTLLHIHRNLSEEPALIFRPAESVAPRVSVLRSIWEDMGAPSEVTVVMLPGDHMDHLDT